MISSNQKSRKWNLGSRINNYEAELFAIFQALKWALELNSTKEEFQKFENSPPNSSSNYENSNSHNTNLIHQNSNNSKLHYLDFINNNLNLSKMDLIQAIPENSNSNGLIPIDENMNFTSSAHKKSNLYDINLTHENLNNSNSYYSNLIDNNSNLLKMNLI